MLEDIDLTRELSRDEYKARKDELDLRLAALQREAKERGVPIVIVFEGWDAAGKGTLINELILPLDPRGFSVHCTHEPNEEQTLRPFLWRFWIETPARGRIAIFDRSWYRRVQQERVDGRIDALQIQQAYQEIRCFERQLAHDGAIIIKFFLHISKEVQKKRFKRLKKNKATAWRVTEDDERRHRQYKTYRTAIGEMLSKTESDLAPWTVVEAEDRRFATIKIFNTVIDALSSRLESTKAGGVATADANSPAANGLGSSFLDAVDLSVSYEREEYQALRKAKQKRLHELEHELYIRRIPVVIAYEGWDAAGKGGNIRRLTQRLDPRGYQVIPIAAPNDVEKQHHYLWRFWNEIPKAGHIAIFDRSWYGRVTVERIEGFCTEAEWKRAYREINEMEESLANAGAIVLKFWIHIDADEQLRRFQERQEQPHKQWKITDEDWRNREKWDDYKLAVDEMILRTSSPRAPWVIVESNCKWYARVKVLDTVINAIETRLGG